MYIDGDTHYWPLRFIDKVSHPGKGYVEVTPDKGDLIRFGEPVPGKVATYYRDGNKIHSFKEGRWSPELRAEFMKKDGFVWKIPCPSIFPSSTTFASRHPMVRLVSQLSRSPFEICSCTRRGSTTEPLTNTAARRFGRATSVSLNSSRTSCAFL